MSTQGKNPKIRFAGFEDEWAKKKFDDVFDMLSNNTLSRDALNSEDGVAKNIHYGDVLTKFGEYIDVSSAKLPFISDPAIATKFVRSYLKDGDIVIADTAEDETVGKCTEVIGVEEIPVIAGLHTMPCRPKEKYAPKYMGYYLNSNAYHDNLFPLMQGVKVTSISRTGVKETNVVLSAELDEQEKIGNYLSSIDEMIALETEKYEKLIIIKKAMLEKMFPKEGCDLPELRFDGFTEPWEHLKFKQLFQEKREKTVIENEDTLLSCAIDGIYLNSELFGHFRGSSTIGYLKVKKYDLILSAQNLHLGNANINLRFDSGVISPAYKVYELVACNPLFMHSWVKREETNNFFLTATTEGASQCRKNIEWETLYGQMIVVPKYEEQKVIGTYFKNLDTLLDLQQQKVKRLKNIKSACMEKMFV